MTYSLIAVFLLLVLLVVYLNMKIIKERILFKRKITSLESIIFQLSEEQTKQNNQLILSDELKQKINLISQTLSQNVYDLNIQLFEDNYSKKSN